MPFLGSDKAEWGREKSLDQDDLCCPMPIYWTHLTNPWAIRACLGDDSFPTFELKATPTPKTLPTDLAFSSNNEYASCSACYTLISSLRFEKSVSGGHSILVRPPVQSEIFWLGL